jgi:hypothetical protein
MSQLEIVYCAWTAIKNPKDMLTPKKIKSSLLYFVLVLYLIFFKGSINKLDSSHDTTHIFSINIITIGIDWLRNVCKNNDA